MIFDFISLKIESFIFNFRSAFIIKSKSPFPGIFVPLPVEPISINSTVPSDKSPSISFFNFNPYSSKTFNILLFILFLFIDVSLLFSSMFRAISSISPEIKSFESL